MLFNRNDENVRDRVIYKTKPNMLLGCKKAIFGVILLMVILFISPLAIKFIGEMQVYLISYVKLSLTRYAAIAFFVIILIDVIYIIWQLVGWYSLEYTLTETKIIIKSGVLSTKKNYMPYATIQDINTSQGIIAKIFNVGSVSLFSAYDNNQMEIKNVSNPSEVEEIIFSRMVGNRNFQAPPQQFPNNQPNNFERDFQSRDDYLGRNDYYDQHHTYEYEPFDKGYNNSPNGPSQDSYYNQIRDEYSFGEDNNYQNNNSELYYNEGVDEFTQSESEDIDDSSQDVIRRHFDKFKK